MASSAGYGDHARSQRHLKQLVQSLCTFKHFYANSGLDGTIVASDKVITNGHGGEVMLYWAIVFLVIAIIAGIFGFGGIAGTATDIARVLFFLFLVLFIIGLILGRSAI